MMNTEKKRERRTQTIIDLINGLLDVKQEIQREITGSAWKCPIIDNAIYEIIKQQTKIDDHEYYRKIEHDENNDFKELLCGYAADQLSIEEWQKIHDFVENMLEVEKD